MNLNTQQGSAQWVALRLLRYTGVTSFDPKPDTGADPDDNQTYLADGDLDDLAGILSAAQQELFNDAPAFVTKRLGGAALNGPATVAISVTLGNASFAAASGGTLPAWITGCTVLIPGDGFVNEITGTGQLRRPYLGPTTASANATVFGNAVLLDNEVRTVLEPVEVGGRRLTPCADREEFDYMSGARLGCAATCIYAGIPRAYFVEHLIGSSFGSTFLRVAPAPQAPLPITFSYRITPPGFAVEDLGTTGEDPGTFPAIPADWIEGIFLPYCLQRFAGSPLFKNDGARPEIARQFAAAQKMLRGLRPQVARQGGCIAFRP